MDKIQIVTAKHSSIIYVQNVFIYINRYEEGVDTHITDTFKKALLWESDPEVALELEGQWLQKQYTSR